ncbi:capsule assembly Wzi family protein [Rhodothermus marinus]|uniref:capsule assembly Wzi family protein n=1 Tax=Rhodothermus marinus TaxID=29549 RepID=UPI001FB4CE35|nr:capsule assembly Wzi family protein [Rhodothermus marinus]
MDPRPPGNPGLPGARWFDDPRHTRGTYLHQKFLYGRLNLHGWQLYGGLVHDAQWGGTSPIYGPQPDGIDDWWRVFWGMGGAPDAPPADQVYYQGNHLGIWDVGLKGRIGTVGLHIYRHFLFNDKDGLKLKNPGDGLLGVALTFENLPVAQLVYEYLYSKRQSGPMPPGPGRGGPGGQDNYYNHWLYRSGWTYYGRTISNPLFFPYPDGRSSASITSRTTGSWRITWAWRAHSRDLWTTRSWSPIRVITAPTRCVTSRDGMASPISTNTAPGSGAGTWRWRGC